MSYDAVRNNCSEPLFRKFYGKEFVDALTLQLSHHHVAPIKYDP